MGGLILPKTFFMADTHFGHEDIIHFERRPFADGAEMNQVLIANWNRVVGTDDRVFLLGDFALGEQELITKWVRSLNGYKILLLGNHDREYPCSWWQQTGFAEVISYPIIYEQWFMLSHEPLYINRNMPYVNIFGHVHANPTYADYTAQSFCVSAERIQYTPIEFKEIEKKIKAYRAK